MSTPVPTAEFVATEIVEPVLGVSGVRPDDDFFDLDATSLHMVQIVARAQSVFGVEVSLPDLFDEPTIAGLAELIRHELDQAGALT
jgi:acyl carrier protein